jgi:ADP-ribose pyrophosphatase YjhB (NUDIX family)
MNVSISGSYRKFPEQLARDMREFSAFGAQILSPPSAEILNVYEGFASLRGDPVQRIDRLAADRIAEAFKVVEDSHLEAIAASDLVWLTTTAGYCGNATAFEIGWALSKKVPVYALAKNVLTSSEPVIRAYVYPVPDIATIFAEPLIVVPQGVAALMRDETIRRRNPSVAVGAIIVDRSRDCDLLDSETRVVRDGKWRGKYTIVGGRLFEGETIPDAIREQVSKKTGLKGRIGKLVYAANMLSGSGYHIPHAERVYVDYEVIVQGKDAKPGCEWIPLREAIHSSDIEPNAAASLQSYCRLASR